MTATTTAAPATARRRVGFWLGGAALLVVVALIAGAPPGDGNPLDPESTGALGARALVLLLRELDAEVRVTDAPPGPDDDVALLLDDRLSSDAISDVRNWVLDGGRLVVADPSSRFTPAFVAPAGLDVGFGRATIGRGACSVDVLDGVDRVEANGGVLYEVPPGATRCFSADVEDGTEGAFVVVTEEGNGAVVAIGGAFAFANEALGVEDNAVLAANLLAPVPGTRVALLHRTALGAGDTDLIDLVAPRVKSAVFQLAVAFALYALWRARRLGNPVTEPQPVQLAGSELVVAVGELLHLSKSPERAAAILRADLRRALSERLGVPRDLPPDAFADVVAARSAVARERVVAVLAQIPVTGGDELVQLAQSIESIRQEVLHGRPL